MIWGYPHVGNLHISVNVYILKSKLFRMIWIELDSIHHEWSKIIISNKNKKHLKTYPMSKLMYPIPDLRFPSTSNCQALCQGLSAPKRRLWIFRKLMGSKKQRFSADFKGELTELELIWDLKLIACGGCSLQKHVGLSDFVEKYVCPVPVLGSKLTC